MKNRYLMIKLYEFHTFYVRNKGVYGAFNLHPARVLGRFLINNISPEVVRYFCSKVTLPVKVYLDLKDIKTIRKTKEDLVFIVELIWLTGLRTSEVV